MTRLPFLKFLWASLCVLFTAMYIAGHYGVRINTTRSAPLGFWRVVSTDATALSVGDYALLCPPKSQAVRTLVDAGILTPGQCRNGESPFVKQVVALSGAYFAVADTGVHIDGALIDQSIPLVLKGLHRAKPGFVPEHHFVAVQTMHTHSIDSRYFGPFPISDVIGIMEPLWTANVGS